MGHQAPDLCNQSGDRDEGRRPARVGEGGDQDVARVEVGRRDVQHDARPPLDGPGRHRQADERPCRHIVPAVRPHDALAI